MSKEEFKQFANIEEKRLRTLVPIAFKSDVSIENIFKGENLKEWLFNIIHKLIPYKSTFYRKRNVIQLEFNRHRSPQDLFRIIAFYKPKIKFIDVLITLYDLAKDDKIVEFHCSTIRKFTFYEGNKWNNNIQRNGILSYHEHDYLVFPGVKGKDLEQYYLTLIKNK